MENQLPLVSVIVPTRDCASKIGECLKSIKEQHYPEESLETIVVDNNSSDKTVAIAKEFTDKIFFQGPERSAQRNFAGCCAKGKYILYLDSDMSLSAEVVSQCVRKCEQQSYIALYIPERITGGGFWGKIRDFERSFYNATVIDAVRFIRRDKFLEIGGFDQNLTGPEDWDLDRRIRAQGRVGIVAVHLYHNEARFSLRGYLQKKGYYAKDLNKYISKWGQGDEIVRRQLGFWYRYFGVFVEKGKWKRLFRHPGLSGAMYMLRLLLGLNYLWFEKEEVKRCPDN